MANPKPFTYARAYMRRIIGRDGSVWIWDQWTGRCWMIRPPGSEERK